MDILKDVSAKVDVLFDHSSGCREEEAEAEVEAVGEIVEDETDNQVIRQRLRRRGRGGRGRKHGNHTVEAVSTLSSTSTADSTESTLDPASAPTSARPTFPAEPEASSAPPTEAAAGVTEPGLGEAVTTAPVVPAYRSEAEADDPVACRHTLVRALGALTQAVQALGVLSAFPTPTAAAGPASPAAAALSRGCEDLAGQPSGEYEFDGHRVFCDMDTDGGGWTVVQRRGDWGEPRENFSRSWAEYAEGFGSPSREFWIGNKWLHRLTASRNASLRVDLWDWEGERAVAEYAVFRVAAEDDLFRLTVADYSGNATDALAAHQGRPFSTWDSNHDTAPACCPCAPAYAAGWWFYSCFEANLNGEYHTHPEENEYYRGIIWEGWRGDYSLRAASMMLRRH